MRYLEVKINYEFRMQESIVEFCGELLCNLIKNKDNIIFYYAAIDFYTIIIYPSDAADANYRDKYLAYHPIRPPKLGSTSIPFYSNSFILNPQ